MEENVIPDLAVIVSAYAVARLLCEYIVVGEQVHQLRVVIAIFAIAIIIVFLLSVISASNSLGGLNL